MMIAGDDRIVILERNLVLPEIALTLCGFDGEPRACHCSTNFAQEWLNP